MGSCDKTVSPNPNRWARTGCNGEIRVTGGLYRALRAASSGAARAPRTDQAKLAELLDVGDTYVAKLEIGARRPSFKLIRELSLALKMPPRELFNFDDDEKWESPEWEEEARRFRRLLTKRPSSEVRLLYDIARKLWR